jgi:putative ABC transport system permease protein
MVPFKNKVMGSSNIASAFSSIWGNKIRSLLTVLGVVIGVSSVTILIALGQGLQNVVASTVQSLGTNIVAVVPGQVDGTGKQAPDPGGLEANVLTVADVTAVQGITNVSVVAPMTLVGDTLTKNGIVSDSEVVGSNAGLLQILSFLSLGAGTTFSGADANEIILSSQARSDLFGTGDPLGRSVRLGMQSLKVVGYLAAPKSTSPLSSQFGSLSIIPFATATALDGSQAKISEIVAKATSATSVPQVKADVTSAILVDHDGKDNFSVLTQADILSVYDQILGAITALVSAIASISLLVGGIGIMNIMLVTVTERTREIGLRKAVGATQGAILVQFLTEAVAVTLMGGLIGLGISYVAGLVIAAKTPITPAFSPGVVGLAIVLSVIIGGIFGLWPAIRAARKDPIESLRYE